MRAVGSKNTAIEVALRKALHALGYRYRLHVASLPGKPDIVFPGRKRIILVHGCFWHGHGCRLGRLPKSNTEFWESKVRRNRERDATVVAQLEARGWSVLIVWQCELKDPDAAIPKAVAFLEAPDSAQANRVDEN